ncbi:MAG TPA: ATP-binding protein, partial [Candidatus Acidoferrum sp.]|nr:ATP-binding protein [Candidatus Acidoferrum sp.]
MAVFFPPQFAAFDAKRPYRGPISVRLTPNVLGGRVLAAVSGGPDSTALLLALCESGHDVVAAHYDHALRDG